MRKRTSFYKTLLKIAGGLLVAILVINVDWGLDWDLYDFLFKFKGRRRANQDIILISVDDATFKTTGKLWPLPASYYRELLRVVCSDKPKVVGFEIEFNYEVGTIDEYKEMASVIKSTGCMTLWGRDYIENEVNLKPVPEELPYSDLQIDNEFKRDGKSPKRYEQYVRRVTPFWFNGKVLITTLAFKAAEIYLNKDLVVDKDKWYVFLTDYAGPAGTYKTISMSDVVNGRYPPGYFTGKIVFVGRGESEYFTNYVRTPYFSGKKADTLKLEVHANIADTIINSRQIYQADNRLAWALTLILSIFTVFVLFGTVPIAGISIVFGLFLLLLLVGLVSLKLCYYVSVVDPLMGVFISYYLLIPYRLVSEYRKRWEFQEANKILSEVEKMKSNFLSFVTHDLKTPIARIQGIAESMLSGESDGLKKSHERSLRTIVKNSEELNNFISRILNLSQIEASQVKLNLASKDINALINEICTKFRMVTADTELSFDMKLEPLFSIQMDERLIGQVIYNLIDNAVKYSKKGGQIRIRSWEDGNFVKVSIFDDGIGIKPDDLKNLFTKFFRVKDARTGEVKGSGLGLYLVKYFVGLHGGQISVDSEYDKGSTFTFSLPVK